MTVANGVGKGILYFNVCWSRNLHIAIAIAVAATFRYGLSLWPQSQSWLKAVDTIGNCQRPVVSLGVPQHMHTITNLWKFELWDMNEIKNTLVTRSCVLSDAMISRPQILRHFRGSRFSQCFIIPTSPYYSLLSEVLCKNKYYINSYYLAAAT